MAYNPSSFNKAAGFGRFLNHNAGTLIGGLAGLGGSAAAWYAPELFDSSHRYRAPLLPVATTLAGYGIDDMREAARADEAYKLLLEKYPDMSLQKVRDLFVQHFDDGDEWEEFLASDSKPSKSKKTKKKASYSAAYSHHSPTTKQALNVGSALKGLNPTDNQLANYGIYGGAGALGGAGIGALVELLKGEEDKDYLKAMLLGGGIGGGLGLGAKALGDYGLSDIKADIDINTKARKREGIGSSEKQKLDKQITNALNESAFSEFRRKFNI